jgi:hypothetical protein
MTDTWNPFFQNQGKSNLPEWLQASLQYHAPPDMFVPPEQIAPDRLDSVFGSPEDRAAFRTRRGVMGRQQAPMPQGMTTGEVGDFVKKAMFGDPDAKVPMPVDENGRPLINQLNAPASEWSPYMRDQVADVATNVAGMKAAGPLANAAISAIKPAVDVARRAPKTVGALVGATAATEAADSSKDTAENATQYTPEITKLRAKIDEAEAKIQELSGKQLPAPIGKGKRFEASRANWESANERLKGQIETLKGSTDKDRTRLKEVQGLQDTLNKDAAAKAAGERPMVERQPWMAALPVAGGMVAAASAMDPRVRAVGRFNTIVDNMMAVTKKAEGMVDSGRKLGPAAMRTEKVLQNAISGYDKESKAVKPGLGGKLANVAENGLGGAMLSAEMSMLPSQIDYSTQGHDTPAYKAAYDRFTTLPGWSKTGTSAIAGLTGASLGSTIPTAWLRAHPDVADMPRVQGALAALQQRMGTPNSAAAQLPGLPQPPIPPGLVPWASLMRRRP